MLARVHMLFLLHIVSPPLSPLLFFPTCVSLIFLENGIAGIWNTTSSSMGCSITTLWQLMRTCPSIYFHTVTSLPQPLPFVVIGGIVTCTLVLVYRSLVHWARMYLVDVPSTPSDHLANVYIQLMNNTTIAKVIFYEYALYCL